MDVGSLAQFGDGRHLSPCPTCIRVHGKPFSVSVGHGLQTIDFQCPECGSIWHTVRLDSPLLGASFPSRQPFPGLSPNDR
jgi:hypothetical protein